MRLQRLTVLDLRRGRVGAAEAVVVLRALTKNTSVREVRQMLSEI